MKARAPRTGCPARHRGNAAVELVVMTPLLLAVVGAIWDVREYTSYRIAMAREIFVVAQAIAGEADATAGPPPPAAIARFRERLELRSRAGRINVAVVVRGDVQHDGTPCVPGDWCAPRVLSVWPPPGDPLGTWSLDGAPSDCDGASRLPAAGAYYLEDQPVLPHEGQIAGTPQPTPDWVSRNMDDEEWWVVVEACLDPAPGLFFRVLRSLSVGLVDTSFAFQRHAAWRSLHQRTDCTWC